MSETATKKPRRLVSFDTEANSIIVKKNDTLTTLPVVGLSDDVMRYYALAGIWGEVHTSDDPAAAIAELVAAGVPSARTSPNKGRALGENAVTSNWKLAAAYARADSLARLAGLRAPVGKSLRDLGPDYEQFLDTAKAQTATWSKAQLIAAKRVKAVMEHYARLNPTETSIDDLFAPVPVPATA